MRTDSVDANCNFVHSQTFGYTVSYVRIVENWFNDICLNCCWLDIKTVKILSRRENLSLIGNARQNQL